MRISFAQMNIISGEYDLNFNKMKEIIIRSSKLYNSKLVVFPELAIQGAQKEITIVGENYLDSFKTLAKENNIWIIPGSFYIKENDKIFNRLFVINSKGEIVGKYDKFFPWQPFEDIESGSNIFVFNFENKFKIGIGICYDIFFPEIARAMVSKGAEILIYPHYTTTSDREGELNIAKAYGIINSAYVATINGFGKYLFGKSAIYDPEGLELQRVEGGDTILTETFSKERIDSVRNNGLKGVTKTFNHFIKYKDKLKSLINDNY